MTPTVMYDWRLSSNVRASAPSRIGLTVFTWSSSVAGRGSQEDVEPDVGLRAVLLRLGRAEVQLEPVELERESADARRERGRRELHAEHLDAHAGDRHVEPRAVDRRAVRFGLEQRDVQVDR